MKLPGRVVAAVAVSAWLSAVPAQADLRDRVVLTNGRELHCRVFSRLDGDTITLKVGTDRQQVARADVASMETVRDRLRELFALLDRLPDHPRHEWFLVGWARSRDLPSMANLLATDLVLRHPDHEEARAFLGHRRRGKVWLWPDGDEWRTLAELEREHASWGQAWLVDGEHFRLRTNASLRGAVDTLLDLERVYLWLLRRFGEPLHLYELTGERVVLEVWNDRESFPGLNKLKHPYFQHRIEDTQPPLGRTYFDGDSSGRPLRLTEVAVQALLYRTLADDPGLRTAHRLCGWGEVGFARYAEHCLAGPAGRLEAVSWRMPLDEAALVLADKDRRLVSVTHRSTRQLHFTVTDEVATDWATVHLFVAYLLESSPSGLGQGFLDYLRAALRGAKGDSSFELDRDLGRKIETLEEPLDQWVRAVAERERARPSGG